MHLTCYPQPSRLNHAHEVDTIYPTRNTRASEQAILMSTCMVNHYTSFYFGTVRSYSGVLKPAEVLGLPIFPNSGRRQFVLEVLMLGRIYMQYC